MKKSISLLSLQNFNLMIRLGFLTWGLKKKKKKSGENANELQHSRQIKPLLLPLLMGLLNCVTAQAGICMLQEGKSYIPPTLIKRWRCGRIHFGTALLQYAAIDLSLQRQWENIVLLSSRHFYFSQLKNKFEQIRQIFAFIKN